MQPGLNWDDSNNLNPGGVRLADLVACLSIATDLGMGQPLEFALKSYLLSLRLGEALGMSEAALPPGARSLFSEFSRCLAAGQVYWKGAHYERMQRLIAEICM